jgi:hypothetical protein
MYIIQKKILQREYNDQPKSTLQVIAVATLISLMKGVDISEPYVPRPQSPHTPKNWRLHQAAQ